LGKKWTFLDYPSKEKRAIHLFRVISSKQKIPILMAFPLSSRMQESLRMSEVTIATRSRDNSQPIRISDTASLSMWSLSADTRSRLKRMWKIFGKPVKIHIDNLEVHVVYRLFDLRPASHSNKRIQNFSLQYY